jgi:Domain of unknown function (DUF4129)
MLAALAIATTIPDADTIRRTAQEVVGRSEYQIRPVHNSRFLWELLERILGSIFRFFASLWDISPVLAWVVAIGLTLLLVVLIAHIGYTFWRVFVRRTQLVDAPQLELRQIDPVDLERKAEDAAVQNDFITAVRLLFRAALLRIARLEKRTFRPGTTNREYLRRYGQSEFTQPLTKFVEVIDAKWYGYEQCVAQDYQACRRAHSTIRDACETKHAHRP